MKEQIEAPAGPFVSAVTMRKQRAEEAKARAVAEAAAKKDDKPAAKSQAKPEEAGE